LRRDDRERDPALLDVEHGIRRISLRKELRSRLLPGGFNSGEHYSLPSGQDTTLSH
jgi:hypothetical protein